MISRPSPHGAARRPPCPQALGRPSEALDAYKREAAGRARRGDTTRAEQRAEHVARLEAALAGGAAE